MEGIKFTIGWRFDMHVGLHAADLYLTRRARTDWSTFMEYVSGR